ncbi:MAG: hypothetical protein LCH26_00875 [Proteobacteria bacterium]|nr:hypothetical protein [Pseudomonadota bacterium]
MDTLYSRLQAQPYARVAFPMPSSQIKGAVEAFFAFLKESQSIKAHIDLDIAPQHRRGEIGYRLREADDLYGDSKEFFHFHPIIFDHYADFLGENPVVAHFMACARPLWEATTTIVQDMMQNLDQDFPGAYARIFGASPVHVILRFLKYDWAACGAYLAKPHYDAGSFTLAIAESCGGLRMGTLPENLAPLTHVPGQALFMVSSNYGKILDGAEIAPAWHDVIQMDETKVGKPFSRWAVVAFVDGHGVEALSREETRKWYVAQTL